MFNRVLICAIINVVFVRNAYLKNASVFESNNSKPVNTSVWEGDVRILPGSLKNESERYNLKTNIPAIAERTNSDFNKLTTEETPEISKELLDLIFTEDISISKHEGDKKGTEIIQAHSNYMYPNWNHRHDTLKQHNDSKSSTRVNARHINNSSPNFKNQSKDWKETNKGKTQHHNISNKNNRSRIHGSSNNKNIYQLPTKNVVVGKSQNKINKTVGVDDRASFGGGCSSGMARVLGECLGED